MILSHKHKFIFLHCRKVAGSTITTLCNRYLGPTDIQTGAWSDTIAAGGRYNDWVVNVAQQMDGCGRRQGKTGIAHLSPNDVNRYVHRFMAKNMGMAGGAHPAAESVRNFDPVAWQDYFKFCFVRNPWTHAVSDYYWRCNGRNCDNVSFKEFLRRLADPERPDSERLVPRHRSNWDIYAIGRRVAVDFVGRYENLEADLATVGETIGIELDLTSVPSAKADVRPRKRSIAEHYDTEAIDLVAKIYSNEISEFGYSPDF